MKLIKGKAGEKIAVNYLRSKNFKIIKTNFTCHWGEIDIIAKKDDILYFFEVKTRTTLKYGSPAEAVNFFKLKSLKRAINFFFIKNKINSKMKLGVISVYLNSNLTLAKIKLYNIDNFNLDLYGTN